MTRAHGRVGLLGPGLMGAPMAAHIARAGHPLLLWARRPEAAERVARSLGRTESSLSPSTGSASPSKGSVSPSAGVVHVAATPRDVAAGSDVVISMLPDLPQLEALAGGPDGLWAGADHDLVLVVSSTVSPAGVRTFAETAASATDGRVRVVDAPVSGGEAKAIDGTLSIMVGGADADVAAAWGVLAACGSPTHLGSLGAGQVAKACNQLIVGAEVVALAEASLLARDAGIDLATLFDVLDRGLASSRVLEQKREKLTTGDYTVSGPAKFMAKDLRFALEAAAASGTPLALTRYLRVLYDGLNEAGLGDQDIAVMQHYLDHHTDPK